MPSFGTLKADTLTHSTAGSLATNFVVEGSVKSYVSAIIDSNTHTIQSSFNVTSLTDDGAGRTDVVFTNSMNNDDYSAVSTCALNGSNLFVHLGNNDLITTSNYRNNTASDSGSIVDYDVSCSNVHGELA